ncbi:MAG: redoxin family protein [Lentisphaeraceae bacterium]|nr:redoxin family protein [Lentisphaeraceae bacterium]
MNKIMKLAMVLFLSLSFSAFSVEEYKVEEIIGKELKTARGTKAKIDDLKGKTVILYFTASWCGPCQKFTPSVVDFQKENEENVEVVVVSFDRSKKAATSYLKSKKAKDFYMVLPSDLSKKVSSDFGIRGIPAVVVINPEGKVVTTNGRGPIQNSTDLPKDWK